MMNNKLLSNTSIKLIAIITMLIDHVTVFAEINNLILDSDMMYLIGRSVGRIAFPLFAFLLVEGYMHTRSKNRYLIRLFVFAFISEIPFDLFLENKWFSFQHQNVFFTLALGLMGLILYDRYREKDSGLSFIMTLIPLFFAFILNTDYSIFGVIQIYLIYYFRGKLPSVALAIVSINFIMTGFIVEYKYMMQALGGLSVIFIYLYNFKRGFNLKYVFYLFYPVHLISLYLLGKYLI